MAKSGELIDSDAMDAWLRPELEGGLLSYVTVDTQAWTRDLAASLRENGCKLSDGAYRALRKRVEDHAAARLSWLREEAEERFYHEVANAALGEAVRGREAAAVRDLLSRESRQLAADVRKAGAKWSKRVLERVKTEMPGLTEKGRQAVASVAAAHVSLCFRWASQLGQAQAASVASNAAREETDGVR